MRKKMDQAALSDAKPPSPEAPGIVGKSFSSTSPSCSLIASPNPSYVSSPESNSGAEGRAQLVELFALSPRFQFNPAQSSAGGRHLQPRPLRWGTRQEEREPRSSLATYYLRPACDPTSEIQKTEGRVQKSSEAQQEGPDELPPNGRLQTKDQLIFLSQEGQFSGYQMCWCLIRTLSHQP